MKARAMRAPRPRSATAASSPAMPRSRSGSSSFPTRSSASTWKRPRPPSPSRWGRRPMVEPAAEAAREAWITGIGIVSTLGEGPDAHWQGLGAPPRGADLATWAPFVIHPIAPLDLDLQIPKKGDQRQMEPWQRIGTYAAGLALDSAGLKGKPELLARTDMIVAAGSGEPDAAVDAMILSGLRKTDRPEAFLHDRLVKDPRPTPVPAQLSKL